MSELSPGTVALDPDRLRRARFVQVGAGNIGSYLAPLLARALGGAGGGLLIIDRDRVEAKNLANQDYRREDVGRPKAEVLAERIRGQVPGLSVEARTGDLETLPLGLFAGDMVFGALDSRRARQALLSDVAWPLGVPVVDGGVGEGLVGRVQVFVPGEASACLECGWGREDYRRLAEEYPCTGGAAPAAPSTAAPAVTGAVVAGLMAAEGLRLLAGEAPAESREIAFDLRHGRFLPSRLRRSARCRFDHAVVRETIRPARDYASATVGDVLDAVARRFGSAAVHLECRPRLFGGDGFGAERFLTPERFGPLAGERLAALGFVPEDRIRVRSATESVLVALDPI
jgi:molybdopterin/thiamine biosynthesis adenylyltransferase